ncbi:hypothetical protein BT93_D0277 [Corymbia citriodora subsp. variegata]|nr:hypothetical protein BT93_D0277 [Corymbia citriodora subsp. variegata]
MRALRTLSTHKHLLNPTAKSTSLAFFKPLQNPHFYRGVHSTSHCLLSQKPSLNDHANRWVRRSDREAGSGPDSEARGGNGEISEERRHFGGGRSSYSGSSSKKGKKRRCWVCSNCGYTDGQRRGSCRSCRSSGTMQQFTREENGCGSEKVTGCEASEKVRTWLLQRDGEVRPLRLTDVNRGLNPSEWRIPLYGPFGEEVSRVLGGGLMPGDPGVGKSTLLLQMAAIIAEGYDLGRTAPVVYVSGEESVEQIGSRADRLSIGTEELYLYPSTDIEDTLEKIRVLSPRALIVDSIQTVYLKRVAGSAGGLSQVKECTLALAHFAKKTNIPVIMSGHRTKSGEIAGPGDLKYIVDVVLLLKGDKYSTHRLLQSTKNRFGSTDEVGVFEMSQSGLEAVLNPSEILLSEEHYESEVMVGQAVAVVIDGSQTLLLKIQALCLPSSTIPGHVNGIQGRRTEMIIVALLQQAGLKLQGTAIFLNVLSGVKLTETAGDLAIAAAICSSFLELPIPYGVAFIGEIGPSGELHVVPRMKERVHTAAKLGYKMCIVARSAEKVLANSAFDGMVIIGCQNLKEVINTVFTPSMTEVRLV